MRKGVVGLAVDNNMRTHAVLELADFTNHVGAVFDNRCGLQLGVDDADEAWRVGLLVHHLSVRLAGEMQAQMLLGNESRAYSRAQVLVEEAGDVARADVFAGLEKAPCQYADGVCVCLHEISHDLCEAHLLLERPDLVLSPWQQRREAVYVVGVDLGYVRIRDDDEGEVAQRLDAVGEACRQNREGEIGRREQLLRGERWLAVSGSRHTTVSSAPAQMDADGMLVERLLDQVGKRQWVQGQTREARDVIVRDRLRVQPADGAPCKWLPPPGDWRAARSDDPRLDDQRALCLCHHRRRRCRRREGT